MGSEGHSVVTVHVTGFKKFYGVRVNPTEGIVSNLMEFVKKKKMPEWLVLGSCTILEAAGEGGAAQLHKILESSVNSEGNCSSDVGHVIWLHLGVNSSLSRFAIETQAVNEATFRRPDELGWKPQGVPIIPSDGGISRVRKTSLPVIEMVDSLATMGYPVTPSGNAGRFVCNYVYYHSLRFAEEHGIKSLFVHVPLFCTIGKEVQMEFATSLLEVELIISYHSQMLATYNLHFGAEPFASFHANKIWL